MLTYILTTLAIITIFISIYTDMKTREVPDYLNFYLIFAAIGVRLIYSPSVGWITFLTGILGLCVGIALAYLFYYTGFWGGGDSKLLMGMGAVIGFYPNYTDFIFFLLALFLLGALYSLCWMGYEAIKSNTFNKTFKKMIVTHKTIHYSLLIATLLLLIAGILLPLMLPFAFLPLPFFYLLLFTQAVEESCFYKKTAVSKLVPGDWLGDDFYHKGKLLLKKKTLNQEDIVTLKKHKVTSIIVKEGVPFTPSFLLGYLALLLLPLF